MSDAVLPKPNVEQTFSLSLQALMSSTEVYTRIKVRSMSIISMESSCLRVKSSGVITDANHCYTPRGRHNAGAADLGGPHRSKGAMARRNAMKEMLTRSATRTLACSECSMSKIHPAVLGGATHSRDSNCDQTAAESREPQRQLAAHLEGLPPKCGGFVVAGEEGGREAKARRAGAGRRFAALVEQASVRYGHACQWQQSPSCRG
eukprot:7390096-Prymnesium_polylepis.1